jgi:hypothetical protein
MYILNRKYNNDVYKYKILILTEERTACSNGSWLTHNSTREILFQHKICDIIQDGFLTKNDWYIELMLQHSRTDWYNYTLFL